MNIIQHHTVAVTCTSWHVIHCGTDQKDNFLRTRWQWVFIYRWLTMAYGIHGKRQNVKSSRLFSAIFIPLQWKHLPILFTEDFFPLRKKQGTIMLENKTRMDAWDNIGPNGLLYHRYSPMFPKIIPFSVDETFTFAWKLAKNVINYLKYIFF